MKILLLEPFYTSSHKQWVDGWVAHSSIEIHTMTMDGIHWKWRMQHAALYFAERIKNTDHQYDFIVATDFVHLPLLKGFLADQSLQDRWYHKIPFYLYFHENQITYPWSPNDPDLAMKRDNHYGWINYLSAKIADRVFFNSEYHQRSFLNSLPDFLSQFPDAFPKDETDIISKKSCVLPIGLDIHSLVNLENTPNDIPHILWNHRWEYDKNPATFFQTLFDLKDKNIPFRLIVAGEKYKRYPKIFDTAAKKLQAEIVHMGYASSRSEYLQLLQKADILLVTSYHDFFGIATVEAIAAGCVPLLPQRLAYPEHLAPSDFPNLYYAEDEEIPHKLSSLLSENLAEYEHTRTKMLKYDWANLTPHYDNAFQ